jgi:hypothetical protein
MRPGPHREGGIELAQQLAGVSAQRAGGQPAGQRIGGMQATQVTHAQREN